MQIQSVNNYSRTNQQTNFKAAYPVIYWVKKEATTEIAKKSAPVITEELTEKLQGKLVRYINRTFSKSDPVKVNLMGRVFTFLTSTDKSFKDNPIVRSFYDTSTTLKKKGLQPTGYLITGKDVDIFEESFAKPIGRCRAKSPIINGKPSSAELNIAIEDYHKKGLNYIKKRSADFCDKNGVPFELHVNFEPIRNKKGDIKDYILSNMTFRPASERNVNPFNEIKK